jgi:hypothetical protein
MDSLTGPTKQITPCDLRGELRRRLLWARPGKKIEGSEPLTRGIPHLRLPVWRSWQCSQGDEEKFVQGELLCLSKQRPHDLGGIAREAIDESSNRDNLGILFAALDVLSATLKSSCGRPTLPQFLTVKTEQLPVLDRVGRPSRFDNHPSVTLVCLLVDAQYHLAFSLLQQPRASKGWNY